MSRDAQIWQVLAPLLAGRPEQFARRFERVGRPAAGLIAFLARHGLTTTIRVPLEEHSLWEVLPARVGDAVRSARRRERVLAVESLDRMTEISAGLSGAGVPVMFLKGPLLAFRLSGEIDDRSVGDIDLLIPPEAVDQVEDYFLGEGHARRYGVLAGKRLSRFFTHHLAFSRGRHMVEVHWTIAREPGLRLDLDCHWANRKRVEVRGRQYPVPNLEASLLIQCLTTVKDLSLGTFRLRSLVDTIRLVKALEDEGDGDWAGLLDRFEAQGAGRITTAALELTLRMFELGGDFVDLVNMLASSRLPGLDRSDSLLGLQVFDLRPPAWQNKRRLFRLYRGGAARAWAWWAVSAPWRKVVYSD